MNMTFKSVLLGLMKPFAVLARQLGGLRRLWAHARLGVAVAPHLDSTVVVLGVPEVHGTGQIYFGKELYLYPGIYLETQGDGVIKIGDGVVLSRGVHLVAYASVTLGDGVMIGEYTSVRDANHRIVPGVSVRKTGHEARPIHIGRNAWIGRGVTILGGVEIGEGAVVGANAVVSRDVPPGAVVAGIPARPLSRKISPD
jgi:acetyltransferase-like isoleucine patch superfamily enzyme